MRHLVRLAALVSVVAVVGATASTSAQPGGSADSVYAWNLTAVDTLNALPPPAGGAAPAAQVEMGMVEGAVYDAVNAVTPQHYRPYLMGRRFSAAASTDAAVATAAYEVLANIVSTVPSISDAAREAALQSLVTSYANSLAGVDDGPSKTEGVDAGHAAAQAMIAARQNDGRFGPSQWVPNSSPGHWSPLLDTNNNPILDPTPWVGGVKPFLIESSSQFRSVDPLAIDSPAYAEELNEVKAKGSATAPPDVRTPTQTYIARWWQSNPMISWNDVGTQLARGDGFDALGAARLFAMQNLSGADAAINCWNDKYHFDYWRPWNAIRRAAEDNNPATDADPTWSPLFAAPYPEYPSGHNCLDRAHVEVLRMFFPDAPSGGFTITSRSTLIQPTDPTTRSFDSFSQALAEIIEARIWAGLHFRNGDVQGQVLGRNVADYMAAHYFQPCLTGPPTGPLTVSTGESICISADEPQTGPVSVQPGGSLDVEGGRITGPLTATGATAVRICGATITGPVTINGSTGPVLVGGEACEPNTIVGPVRVTENTGGVEVNGNHVIGPLSITGNTVPVHAVGNTVIGPVTIQP
jgi:hypothetical protein